jgi:hypothetical protein
VPPLLLPVPPFVVVVLEQAARTATKAKTGSVKNLTKRRSRMGTSMPSS